MSRHENNQNQPKPTYTRPVQDGKASLWINRKYSKFTICNMPQIFAYNIRIVTICQEPCNLQCLPPDSDEIQFQLANAVLLHVAWYSWTSCSSARHRSTMSLNMTDATWEIPFTHHLWSSPPLSPLLLTLHLFSDSSTNGTISVYGLCLESFSIWSSIFFVLPMCNWKLPRILSQF